MKKHIQIIFFTLLSSLLFSGCPIGNSWIREKLRETRKILINTNIIGITGEPSDEPYIEIIYSVTDATRPGYNKTASILVSPPYIFQNDQVYMTYDYVELENNAGPFKYFKQLHRNFAEGGAEFLRIINHSTDKKAEFFFSDVPRVFANHTYLPEIRYKNIPVYFLIQSERENINNDLHLPEVWSIEEITALYRAEYSRSDEINLLYGDFRIIDLVEGKISGREEYFGNIFFGTLEPGDELRGNEKLWLLATLMFHERFESGPLP